MAAQTDKRKQPGVDALKGVSKFGVKLTNVLIAAGSHNYIGVATGLAGIGSDALQKQQDALILDKRLQENRKQILKEVEQQARRDGYITDFEALDEAAQDTIEASFDFEELLNNRATLENLSVAWRRKRTQNPLPGNVEFYKYHDLLVVKNLEALLPLLPSKPDYQENLLAYVSQKASELQSVIAQVQALTQVKPDPYAEFEPKYRVAVVKELDWVELFIERPDVEHEATKQMLSVAYVTLTLAQGRYDEAGGGDVSAERLLDSLPSDTPRALIVGPAGCGKTTLMRWVATEAAHGTTSLERRDKPRERREKMLPQREDVLAWRDKVPFYVRLRDFPTGNLPKVDELYCQGATRLKAPDGWAENVLKQGRGLVLLDGLDELSGAQRRKALTWIQGLIEEYSAGNVFLATSRPEALEPGALEKADFAEYNVRNLSPEGRRQFVRRWHRAVARQIGGSRPKLRELVKKRRQLLRELETNHAVAHLAANPLLCALLCALNRVYRSSLPENLRDLCESACKMLLWDRDRLNEVRAQDALPAYFALNEDMRTLLARNLAYDVVMQEADLVPQASAMVQIADALNPGGTQDINKAKEVLQGLLERSGLLRMCRSNDVEFVHNALRDYLASLMFVRRKDYKALAKKVTSENLARWEPVILFAAAVRHDEDFGAQLLQAILELPEGDRTSNYRRNVMALKTAVRVRYPLPAEVVQQMDAIRDTLLPVNTVARAKAMTECGEIAIEHLAWRRDMSPEVENICAYGLARMNSEQAASALRRFLRRDAPPSVLDALATVLPAAIMAQTVNVLTIPFVLSELQASNREPKEYRPYIHDLTPLSSQTDLQRLSLDNTQVSVLTPLSGLMGLQRLALNNTPVSDLTPLANLTGLQELYLNDTQISVLSPLIELIRLQILSLNNMQISDLIPLTDMLNLQELYLNNTPVSNLTPLAGMTYLQTLSLNNTQIYSLKPLANLTGLRRLFLVNTHVSDLLPLAGMTDLRELWLYNTHVSAEEKERFKAVCRARGQEIEVYWSEAM